MARETLLDFFADFAALEDEFLVWDDGYRTHHRTYAEVARAARAFAAKLRARGIGKGRKIVFWSENRPEWVAALWGCLLEGVIAVPIDFRNSADFVTRIAGIVEARAILTGDSVQESALANAAPLANARGSEAPIAVEASRWRFADFEWPAQEPAASARVDIRSDDIAQIVFTSGATAEPKGVIITHRNLLANIVPVENEIRKYRRYERPFHPVRFLNLLPLSHLFGQTLATFIPPMLAATVVFQQSYHPEEILRQMHKRRVSVLVSVPKILEVLRDYILHEFPESNNLPERMHWTQRWWRFRRVHRAFGWKFWAFITGAAPLDPAVEEFFLRLGFLVIQGYGLTETAPIVTLNHPFHTRRGSVGKPVGGVEIRLADDGEVLVRGGNVSRGYFGQGDGESLDDGWLSTGDIGEMDAEGRLSIRGRKKDMIVLPDGRKVFPEDVEAVLQTISGVRDSAVIGPDQVHAVLVTEAGADMDAIVRRANEKLEDHQKIRAVSPWPAGEELPRTPGTGKLKRAEVRQRIAGSLPPAAASSGGVIGLLQRYAPDRTITPETTLDELGLSSLDRVQLLMEMEQQLDTAIDEGSLTAARTVADLTKPAAAAPAAQAVRSGEVPLEFPSWNRSWPARWLRRAVQAALVRPLTRYYTRIEVAGLENLKDLQPPVIFAPNHQSFMDVPAILYALPPEWRVRLAPAMAKEWFLPHFHPGSYSLWQRFTSGLQYYSATLFFNAFPLPQREMGARRTLRYMGSLTDEGLCVLIFPEGDRTHAGEILRFFPGVAMLASRTRVPVVPVRLQGLERVFHRDAHWPSHAPSKATFGAPLQLEGDDYAALAKRVEDAVRSLA
jgi:long-chain acyl-CoA synthetase